MSNLVVKIKHNSNLSQELEKAIIVANYAIKNRHKLSSKYVSDIGLPSAISNQILRKYGKQKKCKKINQNKIKLVATSQSIKVEDNLIKIIPLKLTLTNESKYKITKVNQIELDNTYAYVCFEYSDLPLIVTDKFIGVDLNATGHCAVAACPSTGKTLKIGKQAFHVHKKYKNLRKTYQSKKLYGKIKEIKQKESNICKDINHKLSNQIIAFAKANGCGIQLEKLTGIRKKVNTKVNKKNKVVKVGSKSLRYALNSWSYYQLSSMIAYKAQLQGIPVQYINPAYTSQRCSICGKIGNRKGKSFVCGNCNHRDHADVNAAFNIALSTDVILS